MVNASKKKYYKIGEVAQQFGIETHTLRFWEREFPQLKPRRYKSGHRYYTQREIEITTIIYDLLYNKNYTIKGAQQKIAELFSKDYKETTNDENSVVIQKEELIEIKNEIEAIKELINNL